MKFHIVIENHFQLQYNARTKNCQAFLRQNDIPLMNKPLRRTHPFPGVSAKRRVFAYRTVCGCLSIPPSAISQGEKAE